MTTTTGPPGTAGSSGSDGGRSRALARSRGQPAAVHEASPTASRPADRAYSRNLAGPVPGPAPSNSYVAAHGEVQRLVELLAPLLGVEPALLRIRVDPGEGQPHGRAGPRAIELTGDLLAPRAAGVVAHELAHARQHANRALAGVVPNTTAAEAEAAGLAAAAVSGGALWIPAAALPEGHTAADAGATGIAPATAPPTTPTPAVPATTSDVASLELKLDRFVAANHSADVRAISGLLDHPWTQVTSEMVENSLRILSGLPFVVARSLVRALPWEDKRKLAQLRGDHHAAYPEACIAVLSALTATEINDLPDTKPSPNGPTYAGIVPALRGVQPERLSAVARRALLSLLRRLSVTALTKLTEGGGRDVFRELFASGPDKGTDEAELRKAIAAEEKLSGAGGAGGDGIMLERLIALLGEGGRENARVALTALAPLCGLATPDGEPALAPAVAPVAQPPTLADLRAAVASAPKASAGSNAPPVAPAAVIGMVATLDARGLIAKLVEDLDPEDRSSTNYGPVLRVVLAARSPLPNLSRATELLSYGIFDWAVRDAEAQLAYLLVRSTPIAAQDTWRQLDNAKWFGRLLDNLPEHMWTNGEYTGVGSEYSTGGASLGVPEPLLLGYARGFIDTYHKAPHGMLAMWIVRNLLGVDFSGNPNPWIVGDTATDLALRTAVIRRLDALQGLNEIIEHLPDSYLFGEVGRRELLDFNQLRDPIHLVRQARALVPSGIFGWITYTHRDAWLAAQAIRALSPAAQQQFAVENPGLWTTVWAGLTDDMRRQLPSTLATGRDERLPTREALRERLSDERLWTEANASILRALIALARAADDRAWVFDLSKRLRVDRRLDKAPELTRLVREFALYHEAEGRTVYVPEAAEASRVPVWGYGLGVLVRGLGILLYDWLIEDSISLAGKTMHLKGFDLNDAQKILGGDLAGVTLAPSGGGVNAINVDATFSGGFIVNVDLPRLEIAGINFVLPGKTYKSGRISVTGLKVSAGFSDRGYKQPGYITAKLGSLSLRDFVLIDPGLPLSGAWAVSQLALRKLDFNATPDGATDPSVNLGRELPKGTIGIPIFGPLIQLLANLVSLQGSIPGDYTLLDYAMIPLKLPFPASSLVGKVANNLAPTASPATYLWGLASDGVLRPPYSAGQRIKDSTAMLRAFNVSFDALEVKGISIGSGQQIQSLVLTDVNLTLGQSLPAYLNAALTMVRTARAKAKAGSPQATELEAREKTLEAQLAAATGAEQADEKRLQALEGKDRWNPGSLSEDERADLVRLTKKLRSDVGLVADIGSITLGPLSGTVQSAGVTLKGIHARAKLPNVGLLPYAPGYLDDKSLIEQFKAGGPTVPTIGQLAKTAEFSLVVDSGELLATDPAQPAVILKAEKLPTVEALRKQLADLPMIEGNRPIRERLAAALEALLALETARAIATGGATEADRLAAAQRVRELDDTARRLLGTEIGGLKFGRITGELDPSTGKLTAVVSDVEATKLAGPGFAVDKVTGSLSVSLGAANVTARPDQVSGVAPATLVTQLAPTFGLSGLTATGVHLATGSIGRVSLGKLTGSLTTYEGGYRVPDLVADHLEIDGIAIGREGDGITGEQVVLDRVRMDVKVDVARKPGGETAVSGATIVSLGIGVLTGKNLVLDMPQADGSTTHVHLVSGSLNDINGTDIAFAPGSEGWQLVRASATVGSFDDVRYVLGLGALKSRTTVTGKLTTSKAGRKAERPSLTASYAFAEGRKVSLKVQDLRALGTDVSTPDGTVTIRQVTVAADYESSDAGGKANATLTGLVLGPIRWKVGTATLSGPGPLTAPTVTLAAIQTPAVPATAKQKAKPATWSITDIVITGLEGNGLTWEDPPLKLSLGRSDKAGTGEPPLTIGRVHLRPAKKSLELHSLGADVEGQLTTALGVKGSLGVDFLSLELRRGGSLAAVVRGVSGSATLSGAVTGTFSLSGLHGAAIDVGPDAIRIGSDDPTDPGGLFIEQISASSLDLTTEVSGHKVHLTTLTTGKIDLLGIHTVVRIDKRKPPVKGKSPFTQLAFEKFTIDRIVLGGLQVDLPTDDVTIVIPAAANVADESFIRNLELTSPVGTDPAKLHPDFTIDLETFKTEGTASLAELSVAASARFKNKFKGDVRLSSGPSSLYLFAGGGLRVDVTKPLVTMKKAAELGKDKTIRVARLGADSLTFSDGRLYVKKPFAGDLEYIQTSFGRKVIWIKAQDVNLADLNYDTAAGGSLNISSLDITNAFFSLNLAALTGSGGSSGGSSGFDVDKLRPAVDQIDGSLKVVLYVSASVGNLKDIRIGTIADPLVVPITAGTVHIPTFESNIKGKVHATQIGAGLYLRPWVINTAADDPMLRLEGNQLQLGVYGVNPDNASKGNDPEGKNRPKTPVWFDILTWDLGWADLSKARADKFSLWAAIFDLHKTPPLTAAQLASESDDARKERLTKEAELQAVLDSLEVRKLTADLSIRNTAPLPLTISSEAAKGSITLSKDALMNLHVDGGIPAVVPPAERPGTETNPGKLDLSLDGFKLDAINLTLYDYEPPAKAGDPKKLTGLSSLRTGKIQITDLVNGALTFNDLFQPRRLSGTITKAHAENISWFKY